MALITSLATLKTALTDELNRSDISTAGGGTMEVLIQRAEQRFQRDHRVREPGSNNAVLVSLMTTDPNWLLTAEPDIYLYGTMVEALLYLKDYERVVEYEARLEGAIDKLSGSVRLNPARTLALTTYAEHQTIAADALNRGDLKTVIPVLTVMAERMLSRDSRVRNLTDATYTITTDDQAVPSGFRQLETWYHDSANGYGEIKIVGAGALADVKARLGSTGTPLYAAILDAASTFRFAPAPAAGASIATKMVYWQTITALASGVNWLYTAHPDIYLWATLAQAGPWVRGDVRAEATVEEAKGQLEKAITDLDMETWGRQWGGLMRRSFTPIGG